MGNRFKPVLIVVDYQKDFASPEGSLSVPWGRIIGTTIKSLVDLFMSKGWDIIFTWDVHPEGHYSFASTHGVENYTMVGWERKRPNHCQDWTPGAALYAPFDTPEYEITIKKGYTLDNDSYSAFGWVTLDETKTLDELLQSKNITHTYITGLATDYCVGDTALDAVNPEKVIKPYNTTLIIDAIGGVSEESTHKKLHTIKTSGITLASAYDIISYFRKH
jgi:nicotinamidase/pyrazinamidase